MPFTSRVTADEVAVMRQLSAAGLSQVAIARKIGRSSPTVWRYLRGKAQPGTRAPNPLGGDTLNYDLLPTELARFQDINRRIAIDVDVIPCCYRHRRR